MTVFFSESEKERLEEIPFDWNTWDLIKKIPPRWKIKENCPEEIRKSLQGN